MNTSPINQKKLLGFEDNFIKFKNLYNKNILPPKILLSGAKGIGKATLSYHLINYIFSKEEEKPYNEDCFEINEENRSFKLIKNFTHPNFHLIDIMDEKKNIEISQIRKMINYTNKSSLNDKPKIILIDNVEYLNLNSINALLKIIEEKNKNIFFILIHNNNKRILETLKSRCINFKLSLSFEQSIQITNNLLNVNIFDLLNIDLINYYNSPGDFINLINFSQKNNLDLIEFDLKKFLNLLIDNNYYEKNDYIKSCLCNYIELYFLKIFNKTYYKKKILFLYTNFINKVNYANTFNLDKEVIFMEFKSKILNE